MENGNGGHAANGNGHANGHVESLRPIYNRALGGGTRVHYSFSSRFSRCLCRTTHAYPNDLVLSLDDERWQLVNTNKDFLQKVEELSLIVNAQGDRIAELGGQ